MEKLTGKKAIVTGGSRGLGKATALAFAKEGIDVAITGRNEARLKETAAELQALGVKATYAVFDVGNYEAVKKGIAALIKTLGSVDILVNNAGIAAFGSLNEMEVSEWTQIIQTNLMGMYYVTKEVLPYLIEKNEGDIVNVSSTAGLNGNATTSAYSASKFAVIGMSESLMKEVRKNNIRVCTLTPSTIASDMSLDLGITDGNTETVLQPEDFAELIVAGLQLPRRAMLKSAALWSTNP
jgi:3-oxoacyl-[acyl-carrier protein] reductase